jgi:gas vesicle protein
MNQDRKQSNLGLGLFIGMAIGAVAGIFMAPKSGKQNREEAAKKLKDLQKSWDTGELQKQVQDIFGDVSDESMKMYKQAQDELTRRMESMKELSDKKTYEDMVSSVVTWVQDSMGMKGEEAEKKAKKLEKKMKEEYDEHVGKKTAKK